MMDASFGSHAAFEFCKCCRRVNNAPFVLGSFVRYFGYFWWHITGRKPVISADKVCFLRKEQLAKLCKSVRTFGFDWS